MKLRIDGGVIVGWSGTGHEIVPNGSVLLEGNEIRSIGADQRTTSRPVTEDRRPADRPSSVCRHLLADQ